MNIIEPILFQARFQPDAPALVSPGSDIITYARLRAQMNNVARRALGLGLQRGSVLALSIDQPLLHAAIILGLTQVGIVPVSVARQKTPDGLKIDAVLTNTGYAFAKQVPRLPLDFSWIMGSGEPIETSRNTGTSSDEICRIVLTSGSTGEPKAVALTHKTVAARNARFDYAFGDRSPRLSRAYLHMGLAAALGYQFLIHILGRGGAIFFHGDTVESTLQSFGLFRIETLLGTPVTLGQFLAHCDQLPSIELHIDTILSGGSLLLPAMADRLRRLCSRLVTGYGSTETAITATAPAHRISAIPGAAGYVLPGARFEIVDDMDRTLPVGAEGIVRVASEFSVDRYIDDPVETAKVFRDGWFYPGDIGSLTADNLLIVSGRRNDILNAGGDKMAPERIEAVLASFQGVREAAAVMADSRAGVAEIWAAIVCTEKIDTDALRAHCRKQMPQSFVPTRIVTINAMPIGDSGKIDRPRVREILIEAAQF